MNMLRPAAAIVLVSGVLALKGSAQNVKVDSLLVLVPRPSPAVMNLVLAAFAEAGLEVTDNSGGLVTSDQGGQDNPWTGMKFSRVVRALVLAKDSMLTQLLITGTEVRQNRYGAVFKRLRIDNRAGGNGGRLWCKMVRVAMNLDSTQVSPDARSSEACQPAH